LAYETPTDLRAIDRGGAETAGPVERDMRRNAGFWGKMKSPAGMLIEVETQSLRELMSQIRFLAATESAKLVARGPIPSNSACCARCQDLFILEDEACQALCLDCLEDEGP
jgi:hypothetical protein